jgi:DNA-binding NarL/FixJ family response regulator
VFILSDVRLFREALGAVLSHVANFLIVGTAGYRLEAVHRIRCWRPDVLLADMAGGTNVDAVRAIADATPRPRIVGLGVRETERDLIACSRAGIHGYLAPEATVDELTAITESVARGESYSRETTVALAGRLGAPADLTRDPEELTTREREVMRLIGRGLSNKEIAFELRIALPTAKNHVHNILAKLDVPRRAQAAARVRLR